MFVPVAIENLRSGNYAEFKPLLRLVLLFVLAGVLGNIIFSLLTTDRTILDSLNSFKPLYMLLAAALALVPWVTNTTRVMIWTRFLGHRLSFVDILKITISTDIGSAISPTAIGGGYVKAGMLMQRGLTIGEATSLMTLGSVENALFFLCALPTAVYLSKCWDLPVIRQVFERLKQNILILMLVFLIVVCVAILYRFIRRIKSAQDVKRGAWSRFREKLDKALVDFVTVYELIGKNGKSRFSLSMMLTAIQWISRYSILTTMLWSFGIKVSPVLVFLLQWVTFTLMNFVPTPGATAGAEASFYLVYAGLIPKEMLGLMTAGWRFLTFYFSILLGTVFFTVYLIRDLTE